MKPDYSTPKNIFHWETMDFKPVAANLEFISGQASNLAYPDDVVVQGIINNLRLFVSDNLPQDFKHWVEIDVDKYQATVHSAGLKLPVVEYTERHSHSREERAMDTPNFMRRTTMALVMGNNSSNIFQQVDFYSRERLLDKGVVDELLKPEAKAYLHSFFTIFPLDAEYAVLTNNVANVIVARYKDFSAALVV